MTANSHASEELRLSILGMRCAGCISAVEGALGSVSGVESAVSGATVSGTESATDESVGTELEPLGVSFSEQPAKTPASAARPMILRANFTSPQ